MDRTSSIARTELERLEDQLNGLTAWHRSRQVGDELDARLHASRENRLDAARRLEARRSEHWALMDRATAQLEEGARLLEAGRVRAVVAHRNPWFRTRLEACMNERGVVVVAAVEDGAEAVAAVVVDQPDLVLVEDLLPTVSGADVAARTRALAPRAVVGLQATREPLWREADADVVFARLTPPAEVVGALLDVLQRA